MGMSEKTMRERFHAQGKDVCFEFVQSVGHDADKFITRCKNCGHTFEAWRDVLRSRWHLSCKVCGQRDDGAIILARSKEVVNILNFYIAGHSVNETAKQFGLTRYQVNNLVKKHHVNNGLNWIDQAQKRNKLRHEEALKKYTPLIDYKKHSHRAKRFGCEFETGINLKKLINRDGIVCRICGKECNVNDKTYGSVGPTYPTIDHIVPLSKGGGHTWANVQVAHFICNSKKGDRTEDVREVTT